MNTKMEMEMRLKLLNFYALEIYKSNTLDNEENLKSMNLFFTNLENNAIEQLLKVIPGEKLYSYTKDVKNYVCIAYILQKCLKQEEDIKSKNILNQYMKINNTNILKKINENKKHNKFNIPEKTPKNEKNKTLKK